MARTNPQKRGAGFKLSRIGIFVVVSHLILVADHTAPASRAGRPHYIARASPTKPRPACCAVVWRSSAAMHVLTTQGISTITVPDALPALLRDFTKDVIRAQVNPVSVDQCAHNH